MPSLTLPVEEARRVVWDDHPDWEEIQKEMVSQQRWEIHYKGVFKHKPSGKFYSVGWALGATEEQDVQAFQYHKEVGFTEVKPVEKTVTVYEFV